MASPKDPKPIDVSALTERERRAFFARINKTDSCWLWEGAPSADGYGRFGFRYKSCKAHRFSYSLLVGPIPEGLTLDHLCQTSLCVNPAHLEPVTTRVNTNRRELRGARSGNQRNPEQRERERDRRRRRWAANADSLNAHRRALAAPASANAKRDEEGKP